MRTRMAATTTVWVALLGVVSSPVAAQEPTGSNERLTARYIDQVNGLSMAQAVASALEREPELQAVRTGVEAARGMRDQAARRPNPTMSLMRQDQVRGIDATTAVEVEWPLDLFRRAGRIVTADREIGGAVASVADRQRLLAAEVRQAYGELGTAVRVLEIGEELVAANQRLLDLVRARVEQGASPPLEQNIAQVELHRSESQHWTQAAGAEAALIELKRLLGLGSRDDLRVRDTLEAVAQDASASALPRDVLSVVSGRSDVRWAEARLRLADARIDAARREGRVDVGLVGGYMRMGFSFPQRGFGPAGDLQPIEGVFHNLKIGAMVMVPFGNRNQGAIATARAERAGAERIRDARILAAESEVASAQAGEEGARRALATYTTGVRLLARQNLEVVRETYALGRVTLAEVLAEQRRYLEIESGYTETLKMAFDARTALVRALGDVR